MSDSSSSSDAQLDALEQQAVGAPRRGGHLLIWLLLGALVLVIAYFAYRWWRHRGPANTPNTPCAAPCTPGYTCVNGACVQAHSSCSTCASNADCPACMQCTGGRCTPLANCCAGQTCAPNQYCDGTQCKFSPLCCNANADCGAGNACDTVTGQCIAQPEYNQGGAGGCVRDFGTWVWSQQPTRERGALGTSNGQWICQCDNPVLYNGGINGNGCSPLVQYTLCNASNLASGGAGVNADVLPASQVPAFSAYKYADAPVMIARGTESAPEPATGGQCPCAAGWGGSTCTQNQSCSGNGTWNASTQQCQCNSNINCDGNGNCYGYTGANCETYCAEYGTPCLQANGTKLPCCAANDTCRQCGEAVCCYGQ